MAEKRKRIRRTMTDAISEAETSSATRSSSTQSVSRFCSRSGTISSPAHHHHDATLGRGRSKQTPLWDSGVKLQVHLTSDGRIDGPDRAKFKTQLGVLARNSIKFPLTCKSFKKIGGGTKDDIWRNIKENTTLPDDMRHESSTYGPSASGNSSGL